MNQIYDIYNQFMGIFPEDMRWVVSLVLAIIVIYSIFQVIKKNFIFIILLVILLPASLPILDNLWDSVVEFIKFLLTKK